MRLPAVSGAWLAAFVTLLAAASLSASLAVTHQAVRSEQRQRAALAALRDYGALLSKMDIMSAAAPTDADYIASWLKCLTADNRAVFKAAAQASRAAAFVQSMNASP